MLEREVPHWMVEHEGTGKHGDVTLDSALINARTKLTTLADINDIFVYDTTKDDDGGAWTCDANGQGSSWYNETLNTATRGATRAFPKKAVLVATNSYVYILDAKDNSMWMRFDHGGTYPSSDNMISATGGVMYSVYALNGKIYAIDHSGIYTIHFKIDTSRRVTTGTYRYYNGGIGERNDGNGHMGNLGTYVIVNGICNDVHAAVIGGKTYAAVATDGGATGCVSLINETDEVVYDLGTASDDANAVWLTSDGTLYILNEAKAQLEVFYNVQNISADDATPDVTYDESSTPALWSTAPTVNVAPGALVVEEGASFVDGKSNRIFIGLNEGLAIIDEKEGDETNGAVKYVTKDYITEEQVGDIRGMWHFTENAAGTTVDDASVKANDLTASRNTSNLSSSGVRGLGFTLASGSSDYLARAYDADFDFGTGSFSISFAFKHPDTSGGQVKIIDRTDGSTIGFQVYIDTAGKLVFRVSDDGANWDTITSTNVIDDDAWHFAVLKKNGITDIQMRIDGADGATAVAIVNAGGSISGTTPTLEVGRDNGGSEYYNGELDELMITAELLTGSQDKHMYEVGRRALGNHTADRVDSIAADAYQQLQGTSNIVKAVAVDDQAKMVYVGTNDGADGGAVTQVGLEDDTVHNQWIAGVGIVDEDGVVWNADDIVAISVATMRPVGETGKGLLAIGTDQEHWIEGADVPVADVLTALSQALNPPKTYVKQTRISISELGKNPDNPPAVAWYGITTALEFTLDTDLAGYKITVEEDYAGGGIGLHFHWTKPTAVDDQSTKTVHWQLKYLVYNGVSENCNSGETTASVSDTYDSAVAATQIVYLTDIIWIPGPLALHDLISLEIMAITDGGTELTDPALVALGTEYLAYQKIPEWTIRQLAS